MNNRIAYLVSKKLTGEISEPETRELNGYLTHDHDLYEILGLLEIAWQQEPPEQQDAVSMERLLRKVRHREAESAVAQPSDGDPVPVLEVVRSGTSFRQRLRPLMMAAALLVMAAASWWGYRTLQGSAAFREDIRADVVNQVTTKPGNRTRVVLRDGTKVWLNADSKLTYANDFDGKTREVNLTGEAYFDVVANPSRPFIIHTPRTTVKVTGTTFNVRDYPGENRSETSLITGKVEVRSVHQPEKVYYLKPNEKIILNAEPTTPVLHDAIASGQVQRVPQLAGVAIVHLRFDPIDSIPVETAWVNDLLAFSDESFREVADKMEKWFGTEIEFANPELESLRFTGKFDTETLQEALEALQFTTPFRYRKQGQTIVIYQ